MFATAANHQTATQERPPRRARFGAPIFLGTQGPATGRRSGCRSHFGGTGNDPLVALWCSGELPCVSFGTPLLLPSFRFPQQANGVFLTLRALEGGAQV